MNIKGKFNVKINSMYCISLVLVIACIASFFYVNKRYIKNIDSVVFFESTQVLEQLMSPVGDNKSYSIKVAYFWQAHCPCDAAVLPHFYELMNNFSPLSVSFVLAPMSDHSQTIPNIPLMSSNQLDAVRDVINYTPSVAIWDAGGKLSYYGPHNLGFVCNAETSFIQKVLTSLLDNLSSINTNTVGEGCFCRV